MTDLLAAFDLEIAKPIPKNARSWEPYFPLGITCAAVALEDEAQPRIWQGIPQMGKSEVIEMLEALEALVLDGYTLLTWNGCKFDFRVVADESGRWEQAARLAADHVDLMLMFTFRRGHFLGLDKALQGAGLRGKRKTVRLRSGEIYKEMDGAEAPRLWAAGETEAVLSYLREDVLQPIQLARNIVSTGRMRWTSRRGVRQEARFDRLYTVRECFEFPEPDTSWMRDPPTRQNFIDWMPAGQLPG